MQEHSFTLYAEWDRKRHSWMIVDDADFHALIHASSPEELIDAYRRQLQHERQKPVSA